MTAILVLKDPLLLVITLNHVNFDILYSYFILYFYSLFLFLLLSFLHCTALRNACMIALYTSINNNNNEEKYDEMVYQDIQRRVEDRDFLYS